MSSLADFGIEVATKAPGSTKTFCPRCRDSRQAKNRRDQPLSVTVDNSGDAVWHCHNCDWSGTTRSQGRTACSSRIKPINKPALLKPSVGRLPEDVIAWFASRGISIPILERNGIGYADGWIEFPYRRYGEVVNIKYRGFPDKRFRQVAGAEKVFYGLDDIVGHDMAIIVEGEMDKLALEEAGYRNVVSVPDGAPAKVREAVPLQAEDAKFQYVWNCRDMLDGVAKVVLALDGDEPGRALEEELARRIGRERCWRVTWPSLNDVTCKDANEVLEAFGPDVLREVIENASPYPIRSLYRPVDYAAEVLSLYRGETEPALSSGWPEMDAHMRVRQGELTVVTGYPGAGKSEFVDAIAMNLVTQSGWCVAFCSFENPPTEHLAKLAEKHLGLPFWDGPSTRMTEGQLEIALSWLDQRTVFIRADDESPTIDFILEKARAAVMRYGIKGLVIDPYNEVEHHRPSAKTETEYVSEMLAKVKRFAQAHGVHVWFVAHPAKPFRNAKAEAEALTLYDIAGSAHWVNKADIGIIVERDYAADTTTIHVKKVRFKQVGRPGKVTLNYDRATGTYRSPRRK